MSINLSRDMAAVLAECVDIGRQAGKIIRESWEKPHNVHHKGAIDLVTETDLAVQEFLRDKLGRVLPEAAFIGEENGTGEDADTKDLCWIVDPVDGTTNFVHRIPVVGISIALCESGLPVMGIVVAPMLGECFHAAKGRGTFLNDKQVTVSGARRLQDSLVSTGFPYDVAPVLPALMENLRRILPVTQGLRRLGAASIDLAYVACGRLDAYFEADLKPWDMAAGWLLVTEAGGMVSGFNGEPANLGKPLLASNGHIHMNLAKLLKQPEISTDIP